ncbi:unnamed protein product [Heterobilharzia americana]|nr:unnamed protein product [Heterobilharzia americana]
MTNTWSSLCVSHFSKHLNASLRKSASLNASSPSLINIYYVLSPADVLSTSVAAVYRQTVRQIQDHITPNTTLIYPLQRKQFLAESWVTSVKLLVVLESSAPGERTSYSVDFQEDLRIVTEYIANGGRFLLFLNTVDVYSYPPQSLVHHATPTNDCVVSLSEDSDSPWKWMHKNSVLIGGYHLKDQDSNVDEINQSRPAIAVLTCDNSLSGSLSPVHFPDPSTVYCYTTDSSKQKVVDFLVEASLKRKCKEEIVHSSKLSDLPLGFGWADYFSNLYTEQLGKIVIWADSMESSWEFCQKFFEKIPPYSGILVCSNIQTKGKGRGENQWISPVGQAAFTFHLTLSNSNGQIFMNYVTCIQHITALSIVLACRHLIAEHLEILSNESKLSDISEEFLVNLQYHGPKILVKWPNDVYVVEDYGDSNTQETVSNPPQFNTIGKLAGVLVRCRLVDPSHVEFLIGCGINAFNKVPTICLEQVLTQCRQCSGKPKYTIAKLISLVISYMEGILNKIHDPNSSYDLEWALHLYTKCWMHTNQKVHLQVNSTMSANSAENQCDQRSDDNYRIVGLDAYGYLLIKDIRTGAKHSLHPDGNSMDVMRGLIISK